MTLKKGWLIRQFAQVEAEVREWPEWMQREAKFSTSQQPDTLPATVQTTQQTAAHTAPAPLVVKTR